MKLKSEGNSRPLGMRDPGCRSSLKNGWAHASMGLMREEGVYSKRRLTRSIASRGVRGLNTWGGGGGGGGEIERRGG